jgi:hypothetical protein
MASLLIKTRTVSSSSHRPIVVRVSGLGSRFERIASFHSYISCMVSVTLKVVCMRRSRSRVVRRVYIVLSHTYEQFTDLVLPQACSNTCTIALCALQRAACHHGRGHTVTQGFNTLLRTSTTLRSCGTFAPRLGVGEEESWCQL